jgi:hypothetical protein
MQLSTSEARAEACTIVLRLILQRLNHKQAGHLLAASLEEARSTGHAAIEEEVEWLFHPAVL